jgi:hypothetical protein
VAGLSLVLGLPVMGGTAPGAAGALATSQPQITLPPYWNGHHTAEYRRWRFTFDWNAIGLAGL